MLFKQAILQRIAAGEVTLAFRRWKRPTARAGGSLRSAAGVLAIDSVEPVEPEAITAQEALRAGFDGLAALHAELEKRREGTLYRIAFHLAGPDPRVALRRHGRLRSGQAAEIAATLDRFDASSRTGPWTRRTLHLIAAREGIAAAEIAACLGVEKASLKRRVRRLKELGLTESLTSGYRLSQRGRALLENLPGKRSR